MRHPDLIGCQCPVSHPWHQGEMCPNTPCVDVGVHDLGLARGGIITHPMTLTVCVLCSLEAYPVGMPVVPPTSYHPSESLRTASDQRSKDAMNAYHQRSLTCH